MLGTIIGIEDNVVKIKLNIALDKVQNLINLYVVMEENENRFIGEIVGINDGIASASLVGELINDRFVSGTVRKPSFASVIKLISKEKIPMIIGLDNYEENKHLKLGKSAIYEGIDIGMDINSFFSNHFAIFGSTGSGKSCGVSRLLQNVFDKENSIAYKASIFIFDAYGEYHSAFAELHNKHPELNFKSYTTNTTFSDVEILRIPLWLLGVDDIALLLDATSPNQLPIIEKAMKLVTVFGREEDSVIKHKNDIIARAILDIFASGRPSAQIRDQVFSILSHYNTKELNLETTIYQPGYTRSLKNCLIIDASGKIREMELLTNFMESFLDDTLELEMPDGSFKYTLKDLQDAFDFALISEGILKSDKIFDETNALKVRLHALVSGEYSTYFDYPEHITRAQYIRELMTAFGGKKAQIINFNINYVDDRFAKTLTKIFSRLFFEYSKDLDYKSRMPIHIILEEAHRYVQNDHDVDLLGYNIFDRITKEGRKYGVLLGLISQRPSELSETSLSQCSNFLIFKMLHPLDVKYIREMVPNITEEIVKRLRLLQPGVCIAFGNAFKLPLFVKMDMPNPSPTSSSVDISSAWFVNKPTTRI